MRVISDEREYTGGDSALALGMFDGVHAAHQALISMAVDMAHRADMAAVVCTFDRHPMSVFAPDRAPKPLQTLEQRLAKFEALGADWALVKPFSRELADMPPEDFLAGYVKNLRAKGVVAGFNYTFGRGAKGNSDMILRLQAKYGYRAVILDPVRDGADTVSSTLIRSLLEKGDQARANRLLRDDV